jgi:hypothetical protein
MGRASGSEAGSTYVFDGMASVALLDSSFLDMRSANFTVEKSAVLLSKLNTHESPASLEVENGN